MPSGHSPFHVVQLVSIYNSFGHWPIRAFDNESMAVRIDHPTLASASPEHASQHYAIQTKIKQQADLGFVQSAATSLPRGDVEQGDVDLIHAAHDYNSAVVVREIPVPKQLQSSTGAPPKSPIFEGSIEDQLKATLGMIDVDECDVDGESAFFVADLAEVYRQHLRWVRELPRIVPFYGRSQYEWDGDCMLTRPLHSCQMQPGPIRAAIAC